jgi:hypothetical protein
MTGQGWSKKKGSQMGVTNDDFQVHVRLPKDLLKVVERICKEGNFNKQHFVLNCIEGTCADLEALEKMGLPVRRLQAIRAFLIKVKFLEDDTIEEESTDIDGVMA